MDILSRHLLLWVVVGSLLVAADSNSEVSTIEGLPESIRNQLPRSIVDGIVIDVRVDHRNGDSQYVVRYHGQASNEVRTTRMSQNGKIIDSDLIGTPDHLDGMIGIPPGRVPPPLPSGAPDGPTLVVPPLRVQEKDHRQGKTSADAATGLPR